MRRARARRPRLPLPRPGTCCAIVGRHGHTRTVCFASFSAALLLLSLTRSWLRTTRRQHSCRQILEALTDGGRYNPPGPNYDDLNPADIPYLATTTGPWQCFKGDISLIPNFWSGWVADGVVSNVQVCFSCGGCLDCFHATTHMGCTRRYPRASLHCAHAAAACGPYPYPDHAGHDVLDVLRQHGLLHPGRLHPPLRLQQVPGLPSFLFCAFSVLCSACSPRSFFVLCCRSNWRRTKRSGRASYRM